MNGLIRVYDSIKYLVLFYSEKYDANHNEISYLKSQKTGSTYVFS